ncbi:GGDEF domain-containing protein [Paenibacillus sp. WQ 127069]|uniref:GGDEF domain-containing protein n=1 Tax=Paenibacillus baimaensis TaxID=2982185 RepID=A0ABT2UAA6_9BACL|nr:GGDEF domain-containing protein [Paenibacillus sp. WQ 127069]MCU6790584.1 GGDEF domain-containing protein [Paenibacillus sp. WQ 127069]
MNPIAFTDACVLIALSYAALKLKHRLFMERYELWSAPLLTGLACIIIMLQPHFGDPFAAVLYCIPIIMAGLRFGWMIALLSTLPPAIFLLMSEPFEESSFLRILQELLAPAFVSSWFHKKESASAYAEIPFMDGLKICGILGLTRFLFGGYLYTNTHIVDYFSQLLPLLLFALVIIVLIAMYNDDNRTWVLQHRLEIQANQDRLTGLPNLRSFMNIAQNTARRRPLSIMMIDIDNFKRFNDTYGHLQGDLLLCEVGQLLSSIIHEHDYAARYGGEEFIVLSHITDNAQLSAYAHKLCHAVSTHQSHSQEGIGVTISIGVSVSFNPQADLLRIISEADEALYASKHDGKNRFTLHPSIMGITTKNA